MRKCAITHISGAIHAVDLDKLNSTFHISSSKDIRFMQRTHSSGVMILHSTLNSESKITVSD